VAGIGGTGSDGTPNVAPVMYFLSGTTMGMYDGAGFHILNSTTSSIAAGYGPNGDVTVYAVQTNGPSGAGMYRYFQGHPTWVRAFP
jgi:hypothetical protein